MKKYFTKIEFKWAAIFIIVSLLWMIMEKMLGWHDKYLVHQKWLTLLFIPVAVAVFVFALKDKKKNFFNGQMSWKEGFFTGLVISIIVMVFSPLTQYIISVYISPDYFKNVIDYLVQHNEMTREAAEAQFNLKNYMVQSTIGALVMGTLTSAIVALFLRTKKN